MPIARRFIVCIVVASTVVFARSASKSDGDDRSSPTIVILVRHAEKAEGSYDTELSPAGRQRARDLVPVLRDAGITSIVTSGLRRTQQTAQPTADELGLRPEVVPVGSSITEHLQLLKEAVRRNLPGVILVVGHANTVPYLMAALNGLRISEICDAVYDNVFVLYETAGRTRTVRSRYGALTPDDQPACR